MSTPTLHKYQERAALHMLKHERSALFMEAGLGKTLTVLSTLSNLYFNKALILGTKRIVNSTWPNEIKKWGYSLKYRVIKGGPMERIEQLKDREAEVFLINYEQLTWLVHHYKNAWPFDVVVFDESSKMKDPGTKRFRAFKKILSQVERVVLLSGTPAANSLLNLWSQLYMLDFGYRLGKTYTGYKQRYFESDYMGYTWTLRPGSSEVIHKKIGDICLSMKTEDYLELPDVLYNDVPVYLPPGKRAQYDELEREMFLTLEENEVEAANAAVLTSKCMQYANGALYTTDHDGHPTDVWEAVHELKLDALEDLIEESAGQSVLVFYSFKFDKDRILKRIPQAKVMDKEAVIVDAWNNGDVPVLLAHPQSAAHGLNMQEGGHIIIWYGMTWSLENYIQANARLHRQGQKHMVTVHHILCDDTVDSLVLQRLQTRRSAQDILMNALKHKEAA